MYIGMILVDCSDDHIDMILKKWNMALTLTQSVNWFDYSMYYTGMILILIWLFYWYDSYVDRIRSLICVYNIV